MIPPRCGLFTTAATHRRGLLNGCEPGKGVAAWIDANALDRDDFMESVWRNAQETVDLLRTSDQDMVNIIAGGILAGTMCGYIARELQVQPVPPDG